MHAPLPADSSEFLLKQAQSLARLGSWEWDIRQDAVRWSEQMYRLYGYEPGEIPITFETYLNHVHPSDRDAVARVVQGAMAQRSEFENQERIQRKDGSERVLRSCGRVFLDDAGQPVRMIGVCQDITEQQAAEAELVRAREDLEARVAQRTAELAEAVSSRDVFMSIASHELKTPLTSLKLRLSSVERAIQRAGAPNLESIADLLRITQRQVDRLDGLIEDLLDASSIQTRQLRLRLAPMNLSTLVSEVLQQLSPQLTEAKCSLKLELERDVTGTWDVTRLEQILVNLVSNIVKYAPGSEVEVRASTRDGFAELSVHDTGPGIPDEVRGSPFERFRRATNANHVRGLGLGLYIVRSIVEQHRGTIELQSGPGLGTRVCIRLPLATPAP
ncbi:MAG: PAS domain-containing sensor histidine kinase [Deltaproteobacteria bacterium]|nr:PAS domain-containing sensor histidine kinase [Deltaproteobacteria bacterium]